LGPLGQIATVVKDLDRAVAFYRDRLGVRFLFQVPKLAFFDLGGVRLMLSPAEAPEHDHPGSILYFKVSDIEGTHAALEQRGVHFISPPHFIAKMPDHDLWMAFFDDTEGNTLGLMEEKRDR